LVTSSCPDEAFYYKHLKWIKYRAALKIAQGIFDTLMKISEESMAELNWWMTLSMKALITRASIHRFSTIL
jgi:hypothetical protein